ncbi:hypothetical protein Pla100_49510 [Neorhodopirellula pilleata]|uniref:Cytochrome c domain-containing protein n=2 Tax=Neorhodopirellula pilleata TaxID=2714738 RepID=A0A5C5ZY10_9BACT|nr:hypothetical protein Pla100_49510 [Neorhodopirellula pilleata]
MWVCRLLIVLIGSIAMTCPEFVNGQGVSSVAIDIEAAPISYSKTPASNRVSRLIDRIESGQTKLKVDGSTGYLKSLLAELDIPISTQTLVFSKTSLQVRYISRRNPRAIYFNDDTYVGWVRGSPIMEISTFDPMLGAAFYTVNAEPERSFGEKLPKRLPHITQATYDCLSCHATSMSQGVPGHVVRSVVPEFDGGIASQRESFITDHTSPLEERWGGWYVTGRHGEMRHMGNTYLRGGHLDTVQNANRLSLRDEFDTYEYLTPYSDIVALMVLEHQTQMHNTLTRADFTHRKRVFERAIDNPRDTSNDNSLSEQGQEWQAELRLLAREVVDALLFHEEAEFKNEIKGSITFSSEFVQRGVADSQGRSLREFDLQTRMFKYPCSYLVHSAAFAALQPELRGAVMSELGRVLSSDTTPDRYPHLDASVRDAIKTILRETEPELTVDWQFAETLDGTS